MRTPTLKRPSTATVLGLLALIVAVAGNTGAFAGGTRHKITKSDLAKGAVTARALAKGAVGTRALAKEAVTATAIKRSAVTTDALAADAVTARTIRTAAVTREALGSNAVTSSALAPGSVYGAALGPVTEHSTPIADFDEVAQNATWTASNSEVALCDKGERLLTGGVYSTNPGNREVGILEALPFSNTIDGYKVRLTSNSGGTSTAEVVALCLK
jgi:hypothetical protein